MDKNIKFCQRIWVKFAGENVDEHMKDWSPVLFQRMDITKEEQNHTKAVEVFFTGNYEDEPVSCWPRLAFSTGDDPNGNNYPLTVYKHRLEIKG